MTRTMRLGSSPAAGLLAAFCMLAAACTNHAGSLTGLWDAVVVANGAEVPFRFEIAQNGRRVEGFFFEGDRKVGSTSGTFENGILRLDYDFLNTTLEARLEGNELRGTYRNRRPKAKPMAFRARRFTTTPAAPSGAPTPKVDGSWEMYRTAKDNSKLDVSWRLYLRQSGSEVSGAILKTSGDTGTLVGRWVGGKLVMSHFAGERPLLFEAEPNPDGTLAVTIDRKFRYKAARTSEARLKGIPEPPDLTRFTSGKNPDERFHFSGVDVEGRTVSDVDPQFQGKVVVITIGGSWCPNCRDEAPFLVDLYKEFSGKGLEVVGLFFENDADPALYRPRVRAFIDRYHVTFPILVGGTVDQATARLSQLANFGMFPTTVVLGRDGRVRRVHAGFASEATGEEHTRLIEDQRALIVRLLEEPA